MQAATLSYRKIDTYILLMFVRLQFRGRFTFGLGNCGDVKSESEGVELRGKVLKGYSVYCLCG